MTVNINELEELLKNYKYIPEKQALNPTYLEIAGFPNWENVYSNILAFFLDSKEKHKFGNLMLLAILNACNNVIGQEKNKYFEGNTEYVNREELTDNSKRIDIVIKTASFVIGIENKIYSPLHNDLKEYNEKLKKMAEEDNNKQVIGIVLSPKKIDDPKIRNNNFVNIIYEKLAYEIELLLGSYFNINNTQYQYLLLDFIEQAKKFTRGYKMNEDDKKFIKFWKENKENIDNINNEINFLYKNMFAMVVTYQEKIKEKLTEEVYNFYKIWIHQKVNIIFDLPDNKNELKGVKLHMDVTLNPLGIIHAFWTRENSDDPEMLLREIFGSEFSKFEFNKEQGGWKYNREFYPFDNELSESIFTTCKFLKKIYNYANNLQ